MIAVDRQRIDVVLKGWRGPAASLCLSFSLLMVGSHARSEPLPTTVSAAEQGTRDTERLRILRDELTKSEAMAGELARRKAERLAAADMIGADDAEQQRVRTLSDIEALKREIGGASESRPSPRLVAKPSAQLAKVVAARAIPPAAWWDVYAKPRRGGTPTPTPTPSSFAEPSAKDASDGAPTKTSHRLE